MTEGANFKCPHDGGRLEPTDDPHIYICDRCGEELTESTYFEDTAALIREAGFDDLGDRLQNVAEKSAELVEYE